jgi:hypothetical protein
MKFFRKKDSTEAEPELDDVSPLEDALRAPGFTRETLEQAVRDELVIVRQNLVRIRPIESSDDELSIQSALGQVEKALEQTVDVALLAKETHDEIEKLTKDQFT